MNIAYSTPSTSPHPLSSPPSPLCFAEVMTNKMRGHFIRSVWTCILHSCTFCNVCVCLFFFPLLLFSNYLHGSPLCHWIKESCSLIWSFPLFILNPHGLGGGLLLGLDTSLTPPRGPSHVHTSALTFYCTALWIEVNFICTHGCLLLLLH